MPGDGQLQKEQIVFLGLGQMGSRMARRLTEAGYPLTELGCSPPPAAPLQRQQ
jgi:3-hydroxyisobutyrate dehydrogenase-like beta-hydroxyacid dehydrogenase